MSNSTKNSEQSCISLLFSIFLSSNRFVWMRWEYRNLLTVKVLRREKEITSTKHTEYIHSGQRNIDFTLY